MHDRLIGYLLGALEAEDLLYVKEMLQVDIEVRRQLELLRMGLAPFEGDREHVEAPVGLAIRTCQQIGEVRDHCKHLGTQPKARKS